MFTDSDDGTRYKEEARRRLSPLLDPETYSGTTANSSTDSSSVDTKDTDTDTDSDTDTLVYPLVQMGPFGISVDDFVTRQLLQTSPAGSQICLASGYFNLTDHYIAAILDSSKANYNIVTASPEVSLTTTL